jgi:hypothetical protein
LGVNVGLRFGDRFAVEAMAAWMPSALSSENVSADVEVVVYGVTGLFYVPVWGRVGPFVGLGLGRKRYGYDAPDIDADAHLVGNVVGGIALTLRDDFGIRFEARDAFGRLDSGVADVDARWMNDLMLSTGVSWQIPLGR